MAADGSAVFSRKDALDNLDLRHGVEAHDVDLILRAVLAKPAILGVGRRVGAVRNR